MFLRRVRGVACVDGLLCWPPGPSDINKFTRMAGVLLFTESKPLDVHGENTSWWLKTL